MKIIPGVAQPILAPKLELFLISIYICATFQVENMSNVISKHNESHYELRMKYNSLQQKVDYLAVRTSKLPTPDPLLINSHVCFRPRNQWYKLCLP